MDRKAFLDQEPPPGYVAGVGRGATGFTTSADRGPVRFDADLEETDETERDGSDAGILAQAAHQTADDDEADRVYEEIDRRLLSRRKRPVETASGAGEVTIPTGAGHIQQQFSLLKTELAGVTVAQWENLPEVGDLTRRNKRQRLLNQQQQRTYAAPDMLIAGTGGGFAPSQGGPEAPDEQTALKLADIEEWEQENAVAGDVEKGRLVLASLRKTNPHRADLWISSARLEEQAKNFSGARSLISEGCARVPHSEDVWLESVRLHRSEGTKVCKGIMNEALRLNTTSETLWLHALDLERLGDDISKRKILMKGLEFLPTNLKLWKALVDLETENDDKIRLLAKATELCPQEWDLHLRLIHLSHYKDAKSALNKARKQLPAEHGVWLAALRLEERENSSATAEKLTSMLAKGMKELAKHSAARTVDEWLSDGLQLESDGFDKSAKAVVQNALTMVDGEDKIGELLQYAESYHLANPNFASHILQFTSESFPHDIDCWIQLFAALKKVEQSDRLQLYSHYQRAILLNPKTALFYMMYAKDKWVQDGDIAGAREILQEGSTHLPDSEPLWMARVKLEVRNHSFENAFRLSKEAIDVLAESSDRVWYKHIHLVRFCLLRGMEFVNKDMLLTLTTKALDLHPECPKLYLQRAQVLADAEEHKTAREVLSVGTRKCPESEILWCKLAEMDISQNAVARARSMFDSALLKFPNSGKLWLAKINLELQQKDMVTARLYLNKSLKACPSDAGIWMLHLSLIPKMSRRKNAFLDALKSTSNSSEILAGIGMFFWIDGKLQKAKSWFERAITEDKKNGDAWAWNYCFALKHGKKEDALSLEKEVESAYDDINKGAAWNAVNKEVANFDKTPSEILKLVAERLFSTTAF